MEFAQSLGILTSLTYLSLTYNEHIGDLAQLTVLRKLHTLHICNWGQASPRVKQLSHLQELQIYGIHATELDLSSCNQLVHLYIEFNYQMQPLHRLVLPAGPDVHLKHLELESTPINMRFILENLSLAHSVTRISFSEVHPDNLQEGDWPCSLPHLKGISFSNYLLPQQLLGYPHLTHLFIESYASNHLPEWFSGLTQLRCLQMNGCSFYAFPEGVLCLSKLTKLRVMNFSALTITKGNHADCCLARAPKPRSQCLGSHH